MWKVAHIYELFFAGYKFLVTRNSLMLHKPHKKTSESNHFFHNTFILDKNKHTFLSQKYAHYTTF